MTFKKKYQDIQDDDQVNRWYLNNRARSPISADIWRRNLGLYCRLNRTTPSDILRQAGDGSLKKNFQDFVVRMISEGKRGAYVGKFKQVIRSWLMFNDIDYRIKINIPNENLNETTIDERVPTREELSKVIRKATTRGRVSISLMSFSGLRLESLGNYEGDDGLILADLEDLDIDKLSFSHIPAKINVRNNLSKARFRYFTFLNEEGCRSVIDYLEERRKSGESLNNNSPLLLPDATNPSTRRKFMRTLLVSREIRIAIRSAGLVMRPYVLRAYFATALDIAESKGLISHPWRQFIMGHKGDIESVYSTNKRPSPERIEEMRSAYLKASPFFSTEEKGIPEEDLTKKLREFALMMFETQLGVKLDDKDKERLYGLPIEEFQEELRKLSSKKRIDIINNGNHQKVISLSEVESFIEKGWDFVSPLPGDKAVIKLPDKL